MYDPCGFVCHRYTKRTLSRKLGSETGIIETGLGRVAVLICNDVEISKYVDEARDAHAWLILNPCFIAGESDTLDIVQERLAGEAVTKGLCYARTDVKNGTAMMVTPGYTFYGAGLCRLEIKRARWVSVPPASRERSTPQANTGNRYHIHDPQHPRKTRHFLHSSGSSVFSSGSKPGKQEERTSAVKQAGVKKGPKPCRKGAEPIPEVPFNALLGLEEITRPVSITYAQHNVPCSLSDIREGTVKI